MELTKLTWYLHRGALAACLAAPALTGCASSNTTPQLADARRAYDQAEDSPAPSRNPQDMREARRALDRAEQAHDNDPGSQREANLAVRAERKANAAAARGEAIEANRGTTASERARTAEAAKTDPDHYKYDTHDRVDHRSKAERKRSAAAFQNLTQVANVREDPRGVVVTMSGELLFPSGEKELSPIARKNLDQIADAIKAQPEGTDVVVEGYTDNSGSSAQNQELASYRAKAVADHLIDRGVDRDEVKVIGFGEKQPIATNDTPEGRASNRRVEIVVGDHD